MIKKMVWTIFISVLAILIADFILFYMRSRRSRVAVTVGETSILERV